MVDTIQKRVQRLVMASATSLQNKTIVSFDDWDDIAFDLERAAKLAREAADKAYKAEGRED